ncbi:hypothetical protein ACIBL6_06365 [Streptomyces sp. NPDC050400]|uniref:hypothetical protein n=1 Tax=Streptomyces sp. NPDC050400 TaxID=3365610 RepID=UPI0037B7C6AE
MRLRRTLALGITATAVTLAGAAPVPAAHRASACQVAPGSDDFPIGARIHPGRDAYRAGGGHQNWSLELTNTTDETCGDIHPVVVLVDRRRTLRPAQIRLEFFDGTRWRPVPFERTDQDENVGVFDDGFRGFSAGPGQTLTVKARLAFTSAARPGHVVATAAVVQRRADDGDWVGESNDYPFDIAGSEDETGDGDGTVPGLRDELAKTGPDALRGLGAAACGLLLCGAALVAGSRRIRPGRR